MPRAHGAEREQPHRYKTDGRILVHALPTVANAGRPGAVVVSAFFAGAAVGGLVMWLCMAWSGLIRTEAEWTRANPGEDDRS